MFATQPSRSSQGVFCNSVPRQTCIFTMACWPLGDDSSGNWTSLSLVCPSDTSELGWSCWARRPWVGGQEFYGGETGPGLSFPAGLFQGRYHFSPSHLLKIAPTFHQQRQSRQDMARAFIFKYSLLPSKSSNKHFDGSTPRKTYMTKIILGLHMFLPLYAPIS